MTINGKDLTPVVDDLKNTTTTEGDFQVAIEDVAIQVDENQQGMSAARSLTFTGAIANTMTLRSYMLDTLDEMNQHLEIPTVIPDGAITNDQLGTGIITADQMQNNSVVTNAIMNEAVTTAKIANSNVDTDKIAANAVTTPKIQDDAVTSAKLGPQAVDTEAIATSAVTSDKIGDSEVLNTKLMHDSVTLQYAAGNTQELILGTTNQVQLFAEDVNGIVNAANANTVTAAPTDSDIGLLGQDGQFYRVDSWAINDADLIPSSKIDATNQHYSLTSPDSDDTTTTAINYALEADNRTFGLNRNDVVSVTYSLSGDVYVLSYIGEPRDSETDALFEDFVALGNVTAYTANNPITLSNDNQFGLMSAGVTATHLLGGGGMTAAVTSDKIRTDAVTEVKIEAGAVTSTKIGNNQVGTQHIQLGDWTFSVTSEGHLQLSHMGTVFMRFDTNGHFRTANDITAFDTL